MWCHFRILHSEHSEKKHLCLGWVLDSLFDVASRYYSCQQHEDDNKMTEFEKSIRLCVCVCVYLCCLKYDSDQCFYSNFLAKKWKSTFSLNRPNLNNQVTTVVVASNNKEEFDFLIFFTFDFLRCLNQTFFLYLLNSMVGIVWEKIHKPQVGILQIKLRQIALIKVGKKMSPRFSLLVLKLLYLK